MSIPDKIAPFITRIDGIFKPVEANTARVKTPTVENKSKAITEVVQDYLALVSANPELKKDSRVIKQLIKDKAPSNVISTFAEKVFISNENGIKVIDLPPGVKETEVLLPTVLRPLPGEGVLKNGILTIDKTVIDKMGKESFYGFLLKHNVEKVIINEGGNRIIYTPIMLNLFKELKIFPDLEELTKMIPVTFEDHGEIEVPMALLRLFGDYFNNHFRFNKTDTVKFPSHLTETEYHPVTFDLFVKLFNLLSKDKIDLNKEYLIPDDALEKMLDFLQTSDALLDSIQKKNLFTKMDSNAWEEAIGSMDKKVIVEGSKKTPTYKELKKYQGTYIELILFPTKINGKAINYENFRDDYSNTYYRSRRGQILSEFMKSHPECKGKIGWLLLSEDRDKNKDIFIETKE